MIDRIGNLVTFQELCKIAFKRDVSVFRSAEHHARLILDFESDPTGLYPVYQMGIGELERAMDACDRRNLYQEPWRKDA